MAQSKPVVEILSVRFIQGVQLGRHSSIENTLSQGARLDGSVAAVISFDRDERFLRVEGAIGDESRSFMHLIPLTNCASIMLKA